MRVQSVVLEAHLSFPLRNPMPHQILSPNSLHPSFILPSVQTFPYPTHLRCHSAAPLPSPAVSLSSSKSYLEECNKLPQRVRVRVKHGRQMSLSVKPSKSAILPMSGRYFVSCNLRVSNVWGQGWNLFVPHP